jgi:hypothetical protein
MKKILITEKQLDLLLEEINSNSKRIMNSDILYKSGKQKVKRLFSRWFPIYHIMLNDGTGAFIGVTSQSRAMLDLLVISSLSEDNIQYVLDLEKSKPIASLEYVEGNVTYYVKPEYKNTNINDFILGYTNKHLGFYISNLDEKEIED